MHDLHYSNSWVIQESIVSLREEKEVITTKGKDILCSPVRNNTANLAPCTHEEVDTRMIFACCRRSPGGLPQDCALSS